jgi:hypothetical protein
MNALSCDTKDEPVVYFSLQGFLPAGQRLALCNATRTLSLIGEGPCLLEQQVLSDKGLRVIAAILEAFPYYCPYEILLACVTMPALDEEALAQCRRRLQQARSLGMWYQETRSLRRVLSSLRNKLYSFHLEISTLRERGCCITSFMFLHKKHLGYRPFVVKAASY